MLWLLVGILVNQALSISAVCLCVENDALAEKSRAG